MIFQSSFVSVCVSLAISMSVYGQIVYDNIDAGTDEEAAIGDIAIDDLTIEGGGLAQSITIAVLADGARGEEVTTDITVQLALDGGDGFPNLDGKGDDVIFLYATMVGVTLTADIVTELTFDVSESYALIPDGALLFGGAEISNPTVGHVFYGEPTIGSTDDFYISFMAFGPAPVPGFGDPDLTASEGLAFRIETTQLPPEIDLGTVVGETIDFEDQEESFLDTSATIGSMMFTDGESGQQPPAPAIFSIDDGTQLWIDNPDMLDFVDGKLFQINGFTGGPDG